MGQIDAVTKKYIGRPDVFADVFNQYVYGGEDVVKPELLREMDTTQIALPYASDGKTVPVQKFRDVEKLMLAKTDGKAAYCLLGVENQADINYAMPVKSGLYDFIQLSSEVTELSRTHRKAQDQKADSGEFLSGFHKEDRLVPVVTLVFYFGANKWDGALELRDLYQDCDPRLLQYAPDYRIHLISPHDMTDDEIGLFQTNLREITQYIKYSADRRSLPEVVRNNERFRDMDHDAVDLINKVTGSKIKIPDGEERVDMCAGFAGALEDSKMEGLHVGREEGKAIGKAQGIAELVCDGLLTREQALERCGMSAEEFDELCERLREERKA